MSLHQPPGHASFGRRPFPPTEGQRHPPAPPPILIRRWHGNGAVDPPAGQHHRTAGTTIERQHGHPRCPGSELQTPRRRAVESPNLAHHSGQAAAAGAFLHRPVRRQTGSRTGHQQMSGRQAERGQSGGVEVVPVRHPKNRLVLPDGQTPQQKSGEPQGRSIIQPSHGGNFMQRPLRQTAPWQSGIDSDHPERHNGVQIPPLRSLKRRDTSPQLRQRCRRLG